MDMNDYGDTSRLSTDLDLVFLDSWAIAANMIDAIVHSYDDMKLWLSDVKSCVLKCLI